LLASVPRLDLSRNVSLQPIKGAPPDPFEKIGGCRFHPRCPAATGKCETETPPLISNSDHAVACWNSAQNAVPLALEAS
jgi:oligopeptide/dipeptide ABC transporter ATP-binding protein